MSAIDVVGFGIADLRDAFAGERVWLIGNGPSAASWTMAEMRGLGGYVFGMNRSWRESPLTGEAFDDTDFHTFVAGQHFDDLMAGRVKTGTAFIPTRFARLMVPASRWPPDRRRHRCPLVAIRLVERWNSKGDGRPFAYDFDERAVVSTFAGHLALLLSIYMGFAEIILVGYDAGDDEGHFFDPPEGRASSPPGFKRGQMALWFEPVAAWLQEHAEDARTFGSGLPRRRPIIVNSNPGSAIRCFPFATKREIRNGALEDHLRA